MPTLTGTTHTMQHNIQTDLPTFKQLKDGQPYLFLKNNPSFLSGDTLLVTLEGTRSQISYNIKRVENDAMKERFCFLFLSDACWDNVNESDLAPISVAAGVPGNDNQK